MAATLAICASWWTFHRSKWGCAPAPAAGLATFLIRLGYLSLLAGCGRFEAAPSSQAPASLESVAVPDSAAAASEQELPDASRARLQAMIAESLAQLEAIPDYSYTLRKQEWVRGTLQPPQKLFTKIRHEPFSVYLRFLEPEDTAGTEAIYEEGRHDGKLIGHGTGARGYFGTHRLEPEGIFAMYSNRYPITNSGMKNTLHKLQKTIANPEAPACQLEFLEAEMVDDRPCYGVRIIHDQPRGEFLLAEAKLLFDRETKLLAHFSSKQWLAGKDKPQLVEDYTYTDVRLNCGFSDIDFDPTNPEYKFP